MGAAVHSYLQTVLIDSWQTDVSGRSETVPEPFIRLASETQTSRIDQFEGDIVIISSGGARSHTPKSAGWDHEGVESPLTIDCRTRNGRGRLEGVRDANNERESYGGLKGELKRILETIRKGDKEFDLIEAYEWRDLSEEVGFHYHRGAWEVRLTEVANELNP